MSFVRQFTVLFPLVLFGSVTAWSQAVWAQGNLDEAEAMFRQLDTNKDGKLTSSDANENNRRMLDQILTMAGKTESGSVTRAEFQQVFEKHRAGRGGNGGTAPRNPGPTNEPQREEPGLPPLLRMLDGNGDQRLTRAELGRIVQLFDRLDTNKDGSLDAAEIRAAESMDTPPEGTDRRQNPPAASAVPNRPAEPARSRPTSGRAEAAGDGSRLAGVWRGWVVEGRGETPNSGQMEIELTVEGNKITGREVGTTRRAPEGIGGGTFVMTGNGASGNLDAEGTSGPQDGRQFLGIYELQGDTLRWCVANRGRQRPQAMATDRGNYLLILRKQPAKN